GFFEIQVVGQDLQQICTALGDVDRHQLDTVDAHHCEERVMPPLELRLSELTLDGRELTAQDVDEEVPTPACRLQEAGVYTLAFFLYEIEHRLDHPWRCEHLTMVGDPLF